MERMPPMMLINLRLCSNPGGVDGAIGFTFCMCTINTIAYDLTYTGKFHSLDFCGFCDFTKQGNVFNFAKTTKILPSYIHRVYVHMLVDLYG